MNEMELEEIAGLWRNEEGNNRIDLYLRTEGSSRYTETRKNDNEIQINEEGTATMEAADDLLNLTLNDGFSIIVWHCKPEKDELIIEVGGNRYEMKKVV